MDLLSDLGVFPGGGKVEFSSPFKLFLGFDVGVEDPLSIGQGDARSHGDCPLVKDLLLFFGEFPVQDFEVVTGWREGYLRERRLPKKRLLLRYRLLA